MQSFILTSLTFLQDLPAEVGKKLPEVGQIGKLSSRHFARLDRLLPIRGKALITKPQLIYRTPLKYRASLEANDLMAARP